MLQESEKAEGDRRGTVLRTAQSDSFHLCCLAEDGFAPAIVISKSCSCYLRNINQAVKNWRMANRRITLLDNMSIFVGIEYQY